MVHAYIAIKSKGARNAIQHRRCHHTIAVVSLTTPVAAPDFGKTAHYNLASKAALYYCRHSTINPHRKT
ncbi:conserved hypothetical protein [Ricinus communis]|uniref:Uncharacterized protein n=1 Tax=Ricinus communis TaxID=3988 RepID=B9S628_RICCO|nr:conserved hypothetical protein [Ricinus communis]